MCLLTRLHGSQVQTLILNLFTKNVASHNKTLQPTANPLRGLPAAELDRLTAGMVYGNDVY